MTAKLTDTQLALLAAAAQRTDRALVLPERLKGNAAQKIAEKLMGLGLAEEIRARGDMPVWRRNDDDRAMALRLTKRSLQIIAENKHTFKPNTNEPNTTKPAPLCRPATKARSATTPARSDEGDLRQAAQTTVRGRETAAASTELHQDDAHKRSHRPACAPPTIRGVSDRAGKATSPSAPPKLRAGTKQAQILALLQRPEGVTIDAVTQATGWLPHSVRGFFSAVVNKRLGLTIVTNKIDGQRVYRIASGVEAAAQPAA
jgi:hypothetical protein